jgi:hypothetical protein
MEPAEVSPTDAAIARLIHEIRRAPELGADLVARYRSEVADYAQLPEAVITNDVLPNSVALVEQLLNSVRSGLGMDPEFEAQLRDSAVRRFHQGVSIEGLLHSYRLWARTVWQALKAAVDRSSSVEVDAALEVVDRIMAYVDHASVVVAQAFFAEVAGISSDRSLIRGDVLDALLGSPPANPQIERRVAAIAQTLDGPHVVVVIRGDQSLGAGSPALRALIEKVRHHLRPADDRITLGIRSNEVVAIYPLSETSDETAVREACDQLARALTRGVVGIGRRQNGIAGIALSYGEAAEAAAISDSLERFGKATHFRDVLLDHLGRASRYSTSLIEDTLKPLQEYDELRQATLVTTLRTFYDSRFSLTRSAKALHVHPNTITYRLRRIHELTGLDPADPDDLLLLSMGLKLGQLER